MIFLDTGYFIALLDARDALHPRAMAWSQAIDERLVVTEHVLWECVNYFSDPPRRARAHALVDHVRGEAGYVWVAASPDLFDAGLDLHRQRNDQAWSLTDCISFVVMTRRGVTRALAYDRHFEQAGFDALLRRDPP